MKIITPEQIDVAEAEFEATGQQPYFILDTANTRFKLPRFKTIPQFTNDANNVGGYNEPKLPNAKGAIVAANAGIFSNATGVMTLDSPYNYKTAGTSGTGYLQVSFDLSRASSIYKDGVNTVQPPTTNFLLYFYLGESEIDDTSITGEVLEELNSKLDNDAGNLTDAGKEAIKSLLPQYTAGVIDSYENGYSWYRVYSDGFCEQGGYKSGSGTTTISLLRAYKNNNYTKTTGISGQNTAIYAPVVGVTNNNSSFSCYFNKSGTNYVYWRTAGFLPEGEY